MMVSTRRQFIALVGAAAAASGFSRLALAQGAEIPQIRIGVVVPARTGSSTVRTSINDYPGQGARMGALIAESTVGGETQAQGTLLDLLMANAPTAEAAQRAAERLVEADEIHALVGGIGEGQAEALSAVAEAAGIPFFNIGSSRDALRGDACGRYTFHIEASAAMYLDAMVARSAAARARRWYVVAEDNADGAAMQARAAEAVQRHGEGGEVVGTAAVAPGQAVYFNEINAAAEAGADCILLLTGEVDQLVFLSQYDTAGEAMPVMAFPTVVSQTRDYIATARYLAPNANPIERIALWETTLADAGADAFNTRFMSRWGEPADPTAWAAYHAVKIFADAVWESGSVEGEAIVSYLESEDAQFDVLKGGAVSFRPWDHQLRQPLYAVGVNQDGEWDALSLRDRVDVASHEATIPAAGDQGTERLDQFGDGAGAGTCAS